MAFFREKEIQPPKQVARISGALTDSSHLEWYDANETNLESGDFSTFCTAFRAKLVSSQDDQELQRSLYASKQGNKDFLDWAQDVCRINQLITGSTAHLSDAQLSHVLCGNMDLELQKKIGTYTFDSDPSTDLQGWISEIQEAHEELNDERARICRMMETMMKSSVTKVKATTTATTATTSTHQMGKPDRVFIPKLTAEERQLLFDNDGCLKCQCVFAGHKSKDCPNDFPKKAVLVTQALVD